MPQNRKNSYSLDCREKWEAALKTGLEEDGANWDWTTLGTLKEPKQKVRAQIVAKSEGVWAANGMIAALERLAPGLSVKALCEDGAALKPGMKVMQWEGLARDVLVYERPFINLASYVGGIATQTSHLVAIVHKACPKRPPRVVGTRKILPGYRDLAIYGVVAGGGHSHRVSLSGGVLIKENHIAAAGGIAAAVAGAREVAPHGLKVEIEVTSEDELDQALKAGVDGVLLDNFKPEDVRAALRVIEFRSSGKGVRPIVEISGGINESTIAEYAIEGVDVISVGSLTHSVKAIDLSLLVDK